MALLDNTKLQWGLLSKPEQDAIDAEGEERVANGEDPVAVKEDLLSKVSPEAYAADIEAAKSQSTMDKIMGGVGIFGGALQDISGRQGQGNMARMAKMTKDNEAKKIAEVEAKHKQMKEHLENLKSDRLLARTEKREDIDNARADGLYDPKGLDAEAARSGLGALAELAGETIPENIGEMNPMQLAALKKTWLDVADQKGVNLASANKQYKDAAEMTLKLKSQELAVAKAESADQKRKFEQQMTQDETEQERTEMEGGLEITENMMKQALKGLVDGNIQTGPLIEFMAPVGADEREVSGWLGNAFGAARKALNPEVEIINQVAARMSAEGKKIHKLGVMSKDDWRIMNMMNVGSDKSEKTNIQILTDQLKVVQKNRDMINKIRAREAAGRPYTLEEAQSEFGKGDAPMDPVAPADTSATYAQQATPQPQGVKMTNATGGFFMIPFEKVEAAKAAGYTEAP